MNFSVLPVGGYRELIANMSAIIVEKDIYLVDVGRGFADPSLKIKRLTAEIISKQKPVCPDFTILDPYILNGYKIKGLFLTHIHGDHLGGIEDLTNYLKTIDQPNVTIYCTEITARLAKVITSHHCILDENLYFMRNLESFKLDSGLQVTPFYLNHSAIGTCGFSMTYQGKVLLYVPDFCLDYNPVLGVDQLKIDSHLKKLGDKGVDYMICEGTVVSEDFVNLPTSEAEICEKIRNVMSYHSNCEGMIISGYGTNAARIKTVIEKSVELGREVLTIGRNLSNLTQEYFKLGLIDSNLKEKVKRVRDLSFASNHKKKFVILTTGHQGEHLAGLPKMLRNELNWIWSHKDCVLILSGVIPKINCKVPRSFMMSELMARRVKVEDQIHKSGHVSGLGLVRVLSLVMPKQKVIVNHGDEHQMVGWYKVASFSNYPLQKITIGRNGKIIHL